ncbi:MAG: hypothetical protein LBH62_09320 [Nitrososphaerota archaeon]|uniref:hypothetical protein n=1 Tax=Candidatus Bathycorpusculum sp. TaxID=2994959 RepID=UPI0028356E04|nr:hypothetical protein [Candidatus Termiticorpusculum sp.]MCL2257933.1 hypothetical protein [Candidatus Termiticorpusculum sp.]MCL2291918.1 hypothetical protein [Candidatus Termiticorpusculum sp.]MDR0461601.1 hypothetical protein [Nitrososphaerota archaeon]
MKAVSESMCSIAKLDVYQKMDNIVEDLNIKKSTESLASLKSKKIIEIFKAVGVDVNSYGLLSMYDKENAISEALKKLTSDQFDKLADVYAKMIEREYRSFFES